MRLGPQRDDGGQERASPSFIAAITLFGACVKPREERLTRAFELRFQEFYRQLHQVTGCDLAATLAAHGVRSLPSVGPLPKASVSAAEAAAAFGYVASATLAKQLNRLMRAQSWAQLMADYGPVVKGLLGYVRKVEAVCAAQRTLYRGLRLPEQHLERYEVGQVVTWHAFGSCTAHRSYAEAYALEDYDRGFFFEDAVPVVFVISSQCLAS